MGSSIKKYLFFNLLVFLDFLPGAYDAELFPPLIGFPEVMLRLPQVENPDAVHAHEHQSIRHQLRGKRRSLIVSNTSISQAQRAAKLLLIDEDILVLDQTSTVGIVKAR